MQQHSTDNLAFFELSIRCMWKVVKNELTFIFAILPTLIVDWTELRIDILNCYYLFACATIAFFYYQISKHILYELYKVMYNCKRERKM